jgi:hypothetical protein
MSMFLTFNHVSIYLLAKVTLFFNLSSGGTSTKINAFLINRISSFDLFDLFHVLLKINRYALFIKF